MTSYYGIESRDTLINRRTLNGPIAIFGRGRLLSLAFMGTMALFSYVSKNDNWLATAPDGLQRMQQTSQMAMAMPQPYLANSVAGTTNQTMMPTATQQYVPRYTPQYSPQTQYQPQTMVAAQPMSSDPVTRHGGVVEDYRALKLREVGEKLSNCLTHVPSDTLRFYVLRDTQNPATYTLTDGSILMTAAAFDQSESEGVLANLLSQRITDYAFQGYTRDPFQVAQYAGHLLTVAGYATESNPSGTAANVAWQPGATRR